MSHNDKVVKVSQAAHVVTLGLLWFMTMYAVAYFFVGHVA